MWRASWNWTKVLYLLTRYIPFVSMAFMARSESPRVKHIYPSTFASCLPCTELTSRMCLNAIFHIMARSERTSVPVRSHTLGSPVDMC